MRNNLPMNGKYFKRTFPYIYVHNTLKQIEKISQEREREIEIC